MIPQRRTYRNHYCNVMENPSPIFVRINYREDCTTLFDLLRKKYKFFYLAFFRLT